MFNFETLSHELRRIKADYTKIRQDNAWETAPIQITPERIIEDLLRAFQNAMESE